MARNTYLFLIYQLFGGGAERVTSILASSLAERGHDVHIGLYKRTDNDYPLSDKVHVHLMNATVGRSKIGKSLNRIRQVSALIGEVQPDFTIGMMGSVLVEGRIAAAGHHTCFISAIRNDPASTQGSRMQRAIWMLAYKASNAVFVQNQMQKDYFPKRMQKKIFSVFNPVSDAFLEATHEPVRHVRAIMTSGRLVPQKNQVMLIDTVAGLLDEYPDLSLSIYGEGPLREHLQQHIDAKGVKEQVKLEGRTNDVLGKLMSHDLFVLPSNYEGMPNALLEAMAVGMPCISTDCRTGPSDMIIDGQSGLLVPVNDEAAMKKAIRRMIENPSAAAEMGGQAKRFAVDQCSVEVITDKFIHECDRFHL